MYFYSYTYMRRAESTVINVINVTNQKGQGVYHVCHVYHAIPTLVRVLAAARLFVRRTHRLHSELVVNGSFLADPNKGNSRPVVALEAGEKNRLTGWLTNRCAGSSPLIPSKGNSRLVNSLVTGIHKGGSAFWRWLRVDGGRSAWGVSDEPV